MALLILPIGFAIGLVIRDARRASLVCALIWLAAMVGVVGRKPRRIRGLAVGSVGVDCVFAAGDLVGKARRSPARAYRRNLERLCQCR